MLDSLDHSNLIHALSEICDEMYSDITRMTRQLEALEKAVADLKQLQRKPKS